MNKIHPGRNERPVSASKRSAREHQRPAVTGRSGLVRGPVRRGGSATAGARASPWSASPGSGDGTPRSSEPAGQQPGTGPPPATARRGGQDGSARRRRAGKKGEPGVQGPQRRRDGADTARRGDDCRQLRTTVEELPRKHNIKRELGVPAEGWSPPADATSTCAFSASTTSRWGSPGCSNRRVTRKREDAAGKVNR